jgi:hypothetical protein
MLWIWRVGGQVRGLITRLTHLNRISRAGLLAIVVLLLLVSVALAESSDYSLGWGTVRSGSGQSYGGGYSLASSIGQPSSGSAGSDTFSMVSGLPQKAADLVTYYFLYVSNMGS